MGSPGYYVGVDGCHGGWVAVTLESGQPAQLMVFEDLTELWEANRTSDVILIDMPIGLLEAGPAERQCEREARVQLGARRASVFPVPCRQAVYARSDDEAKTVNRERIGRSLPIQTLAIRAKIREVDELLRSDSRARSVFREVHPELLFCEMNGGNPMVEPKKSSRGKLERRPLLSKVVGKTALDQVMSQGRKYPRRDLQDDDVLDALVAVVAASHPNKLVSLPADPPLDAYGLPMQMVYWPRMRASS